MLTTWQKTIISVPFNSATATLLGDVISIRKPFYINVFKILDLVSTKWNDASTGVGTKRRTIIS